jgi:hypothetical protein
MTTHETPKPPRKRAAKKVAATAKQTAPLSLEERVERLEALYEDLGPKLKPHGIHLQSAEHVESEEEEQAE